MQLRKIVTIQQESCFEGGRSISPGARTTAVLAVIFNPWSGQGFVDNWEPTLSEFALELGRMLPPLVIAALGVRIEALGCAAIVGLGGEVEHGAGLIHALQITDIAVERTLIPTVEKRAPAGATFDIPLRHVTNPLLTSHHQTVEARIPDAPLPGEIVIALAAAGQRRPHATQSLSEGK